MARRSGLGRGLGALIPADIEGAGADDGPTLREVSIGQIEPNAHQPRQRFDEESLDGLTASIRELGVLQPVLVRPAGDDRFELVAGERRWRAAHRAGLQTIPAIVRTVDDLVSLEHAVVENLHRDDLNPLEEAAAYQQLIEDFGLTHDEVATRVGRSRSSVSNALRLFQLPPAVQRLVADDRLSAGHARALLGTPDREEQEALAHAAVDGKMSVRELERRVRDDGTAEGEAPTDAGAPAASGSLRPPGLLELEDLLSEHLATRVRVTMGPKKGKVVVEFADLEDLERLYRRMVGT